MTRSLPGDAVTALVALLDLDPSELPVDPAALYDTLRRATTDAIVGWGRDQRGAGHDYDRAVRCRRWAAAIDAAWELARHELDVAAGRRRAGGVA